MDRSALLTRTHASILSPQVSVRLGLSKCQTTPALPSGVPQATIVTNLDANVARAILYVLHVSVARPKIAQFALLECSST